MAEGLSGISLVKVGLKRKLMVAFSLMSLTPLLACCFLLFYYIQPASSMLWFISIILLLVLLISVLGYYLMKEIIAKVIRLAIAVERLSTCTGILKDINVSSEDEIGVLEAAINRLVRRIHQEPNFKDRNA